MDRPTSRSFAATRADHGTVRRNNLSLIVRTLRDAGPRSRARLASETGLNKATVSSLVAELVDRGLVDEGEMQREGVVGRPGQIVGLNGRRVAGIGLELNVDYVAVIGLSLRGDTLVSRRLPLDAPTLGPERVLDGMAELLAEVVETLAEEGTATVGVTVAIPGLMDVDRGILTYAPNLSWRDVPVVDSLKARLDRDDIAIRVDNDANLSALAEFADGADAGTAELVYLTGEVGVGGGVIVHGELLRGADGFSGEVGHMPLDPAQHLCGCGRRGCWETMVGLGALLRMVAGPEDPVRNPELDLEQRLALLHDRAVRGDAPTLQALQEIGHGLGVGASILVNVFNPGVIVLGGYFAVLGEFLLEPMTDELRERVIAGAPCRVSLSRLGFTAAARGGAHVALDAILSDPTLVPLVESERASANH
jgi:predicted NBD/HSP70 family sugar kinase/predicted transcriptional regulator